MLKLSLINPYDQTLNHRVLGDINFDTRTVTELKLSQLSLNQPYKLDISFNQNFPYYKEIVANPKFNSFKIQTDYVNLGFIMADGKRRLGLQNSYTLFSSSQKLARRMSYKDQTYTGSLSGFLANLSQEFVYTAISAEPNNFTIETAVKSDLELLTESVTRLDFFAWRENGLIDVGGGVLKPQILYGNFGRDINAYYETSPSTRRESQPLESYKTTKADDNSNSNILQIDDIVENFGFDYYNRLYTFVDTGQGMALNARINVVPDNIDFANGVVVNLQFPLLPAVQSGRTYYYLQVPGVSPEPIQERGLVYSSSSNTEGLGGVLAVTPRQSAQRAYQDAINYARNQIANSYYSITEGALKRICLPGNTAYISYKEDLEGGINLQTSFLLNPLKDLDLTDIKN